MFNTLKSLTGLRIDDERMVDFLEKNGFKYPKKPYLSNRSSDTTYWLSNKKIGVDLLFGIQPYLEKYPPIQGDKKGIFVPILMTTKFNNDKSGAEFPEGVNFTYKFDALKDKLGEPTLKSSDISPTWLNDDGSESFYRWRISLDKEKDLVWGLEYTDDHEINDFSLGLKYVNPLFKLYYEVLYETFDSMLKKPYFYNTVNLMFLQWAIERDLIKTTEKTAAVTADVKSGKASITDWLRALGRGYVGIDDFSSETAFVSAYINRLSGFEVLYSQDIAYTFLPTPELRDRYFGEEATKLLNALEYNTANYEKVRAVIDNRLAEYKEHKFSKSKQVV